VPNQTQNNRSNLRNIAYEQMFSLVTHYSTVIFRARLLVITAIVLVWGLLLGAYDPSDNESVSDWSMSPVVAYVGAIALGFFTLMESLYIKMYWEVIRAGKTLEGDGNALYFGKKQDAALLPFLMFYLLNCLIFAGVYLVRVWSESWWLVVAVVPPLALIGYTVAVLPRQLRNM